MDTNTDSTEIPVNEGRSLYLVTPFSKWLSMTLFALLPFVGGFIGYSYAPEKLVYVDKYVTETNNMATTSESTSHKNCLNNTEVCFDNRILLITEGVDANFIDYANTKQGTINDNEIISFYSKNSANEADFLVRFTDPDLNLVFSSSDAYSFSLNTFDSGMGIPELNDVYPGTKGILRTYVSMPSIRILNESPEVFNATVGTFAHEIAHHWMAYFSNPALVLSDEINRFHYGTCSVFDGGGFSELMVEGRSVQWEKSGIDKFSSPLPNNEYSNKKFSTLSLYIMGLIPKSSVKPLEIIVSNSGSSNCVNSADIVDGQFQISGEIKTVSIDDIIHVYGVRKPDFNNAQKKFTIQVVLLVDKNSTLTQKDADLFSEYLDAVEKYLPFAFSEKATFVFNK